MGWMRIVLRGILLVLLMLICVPLHYLYRIVHYGSPFPKLFLFMAARVVGARLRVHGVPLKRDVFFISNHLSWVDILALGGASGTAAAAAAAAATLGLSPADVAALLGGTGSGGLPSIVQQQQVHLCVCGGGTWWLP
jgi:1-acyl-sn-glycerol-3-phosphate acyltransferase